MTEQLVQQPVQQPTETLVEANSNDSKSILISSHSLAAIKAKRAQITQSKKEGAAVEKRDSPLSFEALDQALNTYAEHLEQSGQKILSSNFQLAKRHLDTKTSILTLEVPNDTIKKELQMASVDALRFLRDQLANDLLNFKFKLSKEPLTNEYAYTPEEKYQKLIEKYPEVEALRKHFYLDL